MNDHNQPRETQYALGENAVPVQVRIARPTDKLSDLIAFYRDGLGLPELARFQSHANYDGVMLGLPGKAVHLEFTQHEAGSPCPAPSLDNLIVLYVTDTAAYDRLNNRMQRMGYAPVEPENPYWLGRSFTYADPDGWRVVICRETGI
ncbi:VOC family protein [Mesorhizobium sp.]|uniref:VOC family protein n=1 Tax=Mesorhizobium sp. TaxID=1871066 RepID=UPI000FE7C0F6|nr:VOC family protein [Mesorhizobium sp.]RWM45515.1 MAG: VOC family protein [Mesorhizobium sp.]RWM58164.1 MAG: VOC family protein [Mesorhizobium sp.]RWM58670.1 MAG: VOC family protein [Mesorhizobium sp.]TIO70030.1 MAG: VOC family protein [Mesorhizobium sp.]TIR07027.1 MAG: VOC family protein [Mesorhizobium sp.]